MQITCKAFSSYLHFQNPLTPLLMILTYPGCRSSQKWKWNGSHSVLSDSLRPPWTVACQAPLSMEFSRQEYWSGLPFPSAGVLPDPGIKPGFPALQTDSLQSELPRKFRGSWLPSKHLCSSSIALSCWEAVVQQGTIFLPSFTFRWGLLAAFYQWTRNRGYICHFRAWVDTKLIGLLHILLDGLLHPSSVWEYPWKL